MILHKNILLGIRDALIAVFDEQKFADQAIESVFKKHKKWGARDRALAAESIYNIIRCRRLYAKALENLNFPTDDFWFTIAGIHFTDAGKEFDNFSRFFPDFDPGRINNELALLRENRLYRESIPDWLDELGTKELGEQWDKEISALNRQADVVLRTNTLKTNKSKLKQLLQTDGVGTTILDMYPDALLLNERRNVFRTKAFGQGFFEVQDASSQLVAPFLQAEPGMRVIDACAGAGGKSLHLAAIMKNKGKIIALDTEQWKLKELRRRAKRNGVDIIEARDISSSKVIKRLHDKADRLLLDVPCSGLGVLKRNPDAKWKLQPEYIDNLKNIQANILSEYSAMLKPGGIMVYATCSILPGENQMQVERFLNENNNRFSLLEQKFISPAESGFDGFYMARIIRNA